MDIVSYAHADEAHSRIDNLATFSSTSLDKSFIEGESVEITLSVATANAVISVQKEVPQVSVSNSSWNLSSQNGFEYNSYITENVDHLALNTASVVGIATTTLGGQIDTNYWTDINSLAFTETLNSETISYAVSDDEKTTWKVGKASVGFRNIVRNNGGTWQYNDTTGGLANYDIGSASYDTKSFNVTSQESIPQDVIFNSTGTKMYVAGYGGTSIYQYTLSTADDVSTASYDSKSFSFASQDSSQTGLFFNNTGTKLYMVGASTDTIYQYTLSTVDDVSTASYDSKSFTPTEDLARHIALSGDGTKLYMIGASNDTVYQYTLSTSGDISTASYDSKSFSVASQDLTPKGLAFSNNEGKLFIAGDSTNSIYQYALSTSGDISTASYDSKSFSVASQYSIVRGIKFNSDGSKLYTVDGGGDTIYQYTSQGVVSGYVTTENWVNATTNTEDGAKTEAMTIANNKMDSTQASAITDVDWFTLTTPTLDLTVMMEQAGATSPLFYAAEFNYDAQTLNQGAVLGTDYEYDQPANNKVRVTSLATQTLKTRIV